MPDEDKDLETVEEKVVEAEEEEKVEEVEEEEAEGESEEDVAADTGKGRAASRIQALANERKAERAAREKAEADAAALRAETERLRAQMEAAQRNRASDEAKREAELLETMDPVQRIQYEHDKKFNSLQAEMQRMRLEAKDSSDKATFLMKAKDDPVRAKYVDRVEVALSEMRAKGIDAPREDIYYYMLGKSFAEEKAKGGKSSEKDAANARISSAKGKTSSVRGDATGARGKSLEDRLADVLL